MARLARPGRFRPGHLPRRMNPPPRTVLISFLKYPTARQSWQAAGPANIRAKAQVPPWRASIV
jgi:hypothetical protein